jgi:protein-S-isoprenylcysteine O-methyltransferase Ste14
MYLFLLPLLIGFALNVASAFTTAFSRRWGERKGQLVTLILRMALGMPLWVVGLGIAERTPSPMFFEPNRISGSLAWLLTLAGCVIITIALVTLRAPAAIPSTRDTLVRRGIYAHIRHPIYTGMLLIFTGLAILTPTYIVGLACLLGVGWDILQARLEELDLLQRMPAYREYMSQVPRFLPRFWQKRL